MIGLPNFVWLAIIALLFIGNLCVAALEFVLGKKAKGVLALLYGIVYVLMAVFVDELNRRQLIEWTVTGTSLIALLVWPKVKNPEEAVRKALGLEPSKQQADQPK